MNLLSRLLQKKKTIKVILDPAVDLKAGLFPSNLQHVSFLKFEITAATHCHLMDLEALRRASFLSYEHLISSVSLVYS